MPLHNVGYRPWNGTKTPQWTRWWIIASTGISLAFKSKWVKRIVFFSWLPVLYWSIGFFILEKGIGYEPDAITNIERVIIEDGPDVVKDVEDAVSKEAIEKIAELEVGNEAVEDAAKNVSRQQLAAAIENQFPMLPNVDRLAESIRDGDDSVLRNTVWNWLLMSFFRYPQATLLLFLLGFIAPGLISRDVRSRAFLLYFSRPIGRLEYVIGKIAITSFYIVMITTLPALFLYLLAVALSPDLTVIFSTWDIPLRILLASVFLVVPTASLALMLSSLTHESRFASFAWFAVWALGHGAWFAILISQSIRLQAAPFDSEVLNSTMVQISSVLSLYNNLGSIQNWIFGFSTLSEALPGVIALAVITVFSLVVLFRRVSAPIRV